MIEIGKGRAYSQSMCSGTYTLNANSFVHNTEKKTGDP